MQLARVYIPLRWKQLPPPILAMYCLKVQELYNMENLIYTCKHQGEIVQRDLVLLGRFDLFLKLHELFLNGLGEVADAFKGWGCGDIPPHLVPAFLALFPFLSSALFPDHIISFFCPNPLDLSSFMLFGLPFLFVFIYFF